MAVDYTKVFTVIGNNIDKVIDYYGYISTLTSDQTAMEGILSAQSLVRLTGSLVEDYSDLKNTVSSWTQIFINRIATVLTDEILIGANFSFGSSPSLQQSFEALIKDMAANDKNVTANTATVGSPSYTTTNSPVGKLITGTKLDGVTPPMDGAYAIPSYSGLTTQLTPTAETVTLTCIVDSETGAIQGSESFEITGTGSSSEGYDVTGENIGNLGIINCSDNNGFALSNGSFDSFTFDNPNSWSQDNDPETVTEGSSPVYGSGSTLKIDYGGSPGLVCALRQDLESSLFTRKKSYFIACWAAKDTDAASDNTATITLYDGAGTIGTITVNPSTTTWGVYNTQVVIPAEITGTLSIKIECTPDSGADPLLIDNLVIIPCDYYAGFSMALLSGPKKFLVGDKITVAISNNDTGKFQTFFRKAFKVQLPTDATPTISDSLVS